MYSQQRRLSDTLARVVFLFILGFSVILTPLHKRKRGQNPLCCVYFGSQTSLSHCNNFNRLLGISWHIFSITIAFYVVE